MKLSASGAGFVAVYGPLPWVSAMTRNLVVVAIFAIAVNGLDACSDDIVQKNYV
jgi:hypothetical protein